MNKDHVVGFVVGAAAVLAWQKYKSGKRAASNNR